MTDRLFGVIQVISDGILKIGDVPFKHALKNATMPIKRQGRSIRSVETLDAVAKHVTAKDLNEVNEPLASTCPGEYFMKLGVQLRKD